MDIDDLAALDVQDADAQPRQFDLPVDYLYLGAGVERLAGDTAPPICWRHASDHSSLIILRTVVPHASAILSAVSSCGIT